MYPTTEKKGIVHTLGYKKSGQTMNELAAPKHEVKKNK